MVTGLKRESPEDLKTYVCTFYTHTHTHTHTPVTKVSNIHDEAEKQKIWSQNTALKMERRELVKLNLVTLLSLNSSKR